MNALVGQLSHRACVAYDYSVVRHFASPSKNPYFTGSLLFVTPPHFVKAGLQGPPFVSAEKPHGVVLELQPPDSCKNGVPLRTQIGLRAAEKYCERPSHATSAT